MTNPGAAVAGQYVLAFVWDARRISFDLDGGVDSEDVSSCSRPNTLHDAGLRFGDESFQVGILWACASLTELCGADGP